MQKSYPIKFKMLHRKKEKKKLLSKLGIGMNFISLIRVIEKGFNKIQHSFNKIQHSPNKD